MNQSSLSLDHIPFPSARPAGAVLASGLPILAPLAPDARTPIETFSNPILPAPSADPWMLFHEGAYLYCESRNQHSIYLRKSKELHTIADDPGTLVWTAPATGMNSNAVWAPELHFIDGRWYIYYAADDGQNENHRMWVLESEGDDPFGPYTDRGVLETGGWAIDGTILRLDGRLYFVWSGWPGKVNGLQNLYLAPMHNPTALAGERVCICTPSETWERVDMPIAEGPQILQRDGRLFIVYSASGSWTVDYCLGLLAHTGGDVMDSGSWQKRGPVFRKTREVWGVGHCSFVPSPDGCEDWIVYHAKSKRKKGWLDRHVHAQRFAWDADGYPVFGAPVSASRSLPVPAGSAV